MKYYLDQCRDKIENRFYVYLHRRGTDNSVFYVGKGCGSRAWNFNGRSKFWHSTKNKYGITVEIVFDNLQEDEALLCEVDTILEMKYFGCKLVNLTSGGDSPVLSKETRQLMSISRRGKKKSDVHRMRIGAAHKGKKRSDLSGIRNANSDKEIYDFLNVNTLEIFSGTRLQLCEKYNLDSGLLCGLFLKKPRRVSQGWGLMDIDTSISDNVTALIRQRSKGRREVYNFIHSSGNMFTGTRQDLSDKFDVNIDLIHALFCKNPRPSANGWSLLKEENGTNSNSKDKA